MQQWRVRIKGKHLQEINRALLMQAVIALGKQLQSEAGASIKRHEANEKEKREEDI